MPRGVDLLGVLALVVALGTVGAVGYVAIVLVRWARRTGRRPWLWLLAAYVAANILWAILRPFLERP
jgi:hypothetical protein